MNLSRRAVLITAAFFVAIVIMGTSAAMWLYRNAALASGEQHLRNIAVALAEQSRQGVLTVDSTLRATGEEYTAQLSSAQPSEKALHDRMAQRVAELPQLRALLIIDPRGALVAHSETFPAAKMSFADRDYFRAQREGGAQLYFGVPVKGRVVREWTLPVSRRISGPHGEFLGVVAAAISIPYLHGVYRPLELGPEGRVFLFREDGVLLTGFPMQENDLGHSFSTHPLFTREKTPAVSGVLHTSGLVDGYSRLIGYERTPDYPLIVAASSTVAYVLAEWRRQSVYATAAALITIAVILLAAIVLLRQQRRSEALAGEHQRSQEQLRESEARLNAIIDSAMDAIITVDARQNIVLFNAAAEKIFRCPADEAMGRRLDRFVPERYRMAHRAHVERFGETGVTMRRMGENIVLAGLRANGEEFPIDASISQVDIGANRFYTVILRDITERQKAAAALEESHRELRELYAVMHDVREAERTRIARELHDELAQWLTALKMDVSWVAARLPKDLPRIADRTQRMKEVVDTTVAAVRRIAADLRPVMIDDLGLVPAIEHLLHEFSERSGIAVSLDTEVAGVAFRDPIATAIYRMVQEALTNVARHAEATLVEVKMGRSGGDLVVNVRDNGRGIDDAALRKAKSYGVLGIRERAQTLGGTARIYRAEEGGTTVEITIPLRDYLRGKEAAA